MYIYFGLRRLGRRDLGRSRGTFEGTPAEPTCGLGQ